MAKDKDKKHDHSLTKKLKGILFALVMLLPFFAIGTTSLYVIFNKNAKDSYTGNYSFTETTYISDAKTIDSSNSTSIYSSGYNLAFTENYFDNEFYTLDLKLFNEQALVRFGFNYKNIEFSDITLNPNDNEQSVIIGTNALGTDSNIIIWYYNNDLSFLKTTTVSSPDWYRNYGTPTRQKSISRSNALKTTIKFTNNDRTLYYTGGNNNTFVNNNISKNISYSTFTNDNTLSNVFYAQTEKIWQAPLFNWVINGPFYTGMTGFTNLFGIPNQTFFSNLLVYWLTMICIYLIIDIVLEIFIYLSHFLFEKKADI